MMHNLAEQVRKPNWDGVRPIYKKLSDEFSLLTSAYNLTIDPERKLMLDHLIIVIDEVDKCVDELPTQVQRDDVTARLIQFLKNDDPELVHPLIDDALALKMLNIKTVVRMKGIVAPFVHAAEQIFHFTEIKRHTTVKSELVNYIMQEGEATALMPLTILGISPEHPFGAFFSGLCRLMGIADLVVDARSDYKLNYIVYKPDLGLYFTLNKILISEGLSLLINFPRRLQFIWYCLKFSWALFTEEKK